MPQDRFRNYAFVLYPESAPPDWEATLRNFHVPCVLSPPHDRDIDKDGRPEKCHYHVILKFDSVQSIKQVLDLLKVFNIKHVEPIKAIRAYERYLIHMDDPDKFQYSKSDVKCFSGASYLADEEESYAIVNDIFDFINDYERDNHKSLTRRMFVDIARKKSDWMRVLCNYSMLRLIEWYLV